MIIFFFAWINLGQKIVRSYLDYSRLGIKPDHFLRTFATENQRRFFLHNVAQKCRAQNGQEAH